MRRRDMLGFAVLLGLLAAGAAAASAQPSGAPEGPWPMAGGGPSHGGTVDGPPPPYRTAWEARLGDGVPIGGPVVGHDLVVVSGGTEVVALDAADGSERWSVTRERGDDGPAAILSDAVVFVSGGADDEDPALVAVDVEDGTRIWSFPIDGTTHGGVTAAGGRLYLVTREGTVWAVEATGEEAWRSEVDGRGESVPAVADGRVFVTTTRLSEREAWLHVLDAETGEREWRYTPQEPVVGMSSASVGDGVVYVGVGDRTVRAFDAEDGRERWATDVRASFAPRMIPALPGDLLIGDVAGDLYRLDPDAGLERWDFRVPGSLITGAPAVSSGAALVGDDSGQISAVDLERGLLVWKRSLGEDRLHSVAVAEDRLYVASRGGRIVALEHDPDGVLLEEPSPTTLFPGRALLNFAAAAALVVGVLLLVFRVLLRGRREEPVMGASRSEDA